MKSSPLELRAALFVLSVFLPNLSQSQVYSRAAQLDGRQNGGCTSENVIAFDVKRNFWTHKPRVYDGVIAYVKHDPVGSAPTYTPTDELFVWDTRKQREVKISNHFAVDFMSIAISKNIVIATATGINGSGSQIEAYYAGADGFFGPNQQGLTDDKYAVIHTDPSYLFDAIDVFSFGSGIIDVLARKTLFIVHAGYERIQYDFNPYGVGKTVVPLAASSFSYMSGETPVALVWGSLSGQLESLASHYYGTWTNFATRADILSPAGNLGTGSGTLASTLLRGKNKLLTLLEESTALGQRPRKNFLSVGAAASRYYPTYQITPDYAQTGEVIRSAAMGEADPLGHGYVVVELYAGIDLIRIFGTASFPSMRIAFGASWPDVDQNDVIYMRQQNLIHRVCRIF